LSSGEGSTIRYVLIARWVTGLQCPRLVWAQFHEPEKIPETDPVTQHIFDQGHLVGELAKKLFPGGIDISTDDFMGNISSTIDLLRKKETFQKALESAVAVALMKFLEGLEA